MNPSNPSDPYNGHDSATDEGMTPDEYAALLDDNKCTDAQGRTDAPSGECSCCGGNADGSVDVTITPLVRGGQGRPDYDPEPRLNWRCYMGWHDYKGVAEAHVYPRKKCKRCNRVLVYFFGAWRLYNKGGAS